MMSTSLGNTSLCNSFVHRREGASRSHPTFCTMGEAGHKHCSGVYISLLSRCTWICIDCASLCMQRIHTYANRHKTVHPTLRPCAHAFVSSETPRLLPGDARRQGVVRRAPAGGCSAGAENTRNEARWVQQGWLCSLCSPHPALRRYKVRS